jgi:hypothetical protein
MSDGAATPPPVSSRSRGRAALALVAAVTLALLGSSLSGSLQPAGGREAVTAACTLQVAPPPGQPLFVLLGHGFCGLPWMSPAGRLALMSLLCGLWAVLGIFGTLARITGDRFAAVAAALTCAVGEVFWRRASMAGPEALYAALCVSVVYAAVRAAGAATPRGQAGWAAAAGAALGLGLCVHPAALLVAPLALLAGIRGGRGTLRSLPAALAGAALGLLPYLQLRLAPGPSVWGDTRSWHGVLSHLLDRGDAGLPEPAGAAAGGALASLGPFFVQIPLQVGWVLWPLSLLGLLVLAYRAAGRPLGRVLEPRLGRPLAAALALLPLLAGPLVALFVDQPADPLSRLASERWLLLPALSLCLALGVGLAHLGRTLFWGRRRTFWQAALLSVVGLAALVVHGRADPGQDYLLEDYAKNCLSVAARGAVILGDGASREAALPYAQELLRVRPDVQFVDLPLMTRESYVRRKRQERPGFSLPRAAREEVDLLRLVHGELDRGVPVYFATVASHKLRSAFAGFPTGPLWRVLPLGVTRPTARDLQRTNRRLFRGLSRRGRAPDLEPGSWAAYLLSPYARAWNAVARALYHSGDRRGALKALARAQQWAPGSPVPAWFGRRSPRRPAPR